MEQKTISPGKDEQIINDILEGNTDRYELLMRKYNQRLYRIGKGFFSDDDEIEDIMQFSYIRAFEKLSSFERRSAFSTWLIRIFINEAISRKKYRDRNIVITNEDESLPGIAIRKNEMNTPEKNIINDELKEILETAIQKLPEKYRTVFIMHEIENISVKETGESLDLTESNVKVRLNRARKMLQSTLRSYYNPEEILSFNLIRCDYIVNNVLAAIKKNMQYS